MTTKPITHTLPLTIGAARLIQALSLNFGATEAAHVVALGNFAEEHLSRLPAVPEGPVADADARAYKNQPFEVEVSERTREGIKAVCKAALAKQGIPGTYEAAVLLTAVGMDV